MDTDVFDVCEDGVIHYEPTQDKVFNEVWEEGLDRRTKVPPNPFADGSVNAPLKVMRLTAIRNAIYKAKGNKSKAAKILGISKATLYRAVGAEQLCLNCQEDKDK